MRIRVPAVPASFFGMVIGSEVSRMASHQLGCWIAKAFTARKAGRAG